MAFQIATPNVGAKMLGTFAAISEENRKRKEFDLNVEKAYQGLMIKDAMLSLREQGLQLNAVKTASNYEIALGKLALAQTEAERKAAETELNMLKKQFEFDAEKADFSAATEAASILATPGKDGRTLHQRLWSDNSAEASEAMREFVGTAGRLQGKGKRTAGIFDSIRRSFNDKQRQLEGQEDAALAARREERMAATAESSAARADRSITNQERRTDIMASEAERKKAQAFGGGSSKGQGEFFPGGSAKVKVPGFGTMSLDQIRETLGAGGEVATKLKDAMKRVPGGQTADGEPLPGLWDDAALNELEQQGKQIKAQKKSGASATKTPSGVAIDPAQPLQINPDPTGLDSIFERPTLPAGGTPGAADEGILPPLNGPGAGTGPLGANTEEFFGLPRAVTMA